MLKKTLQFFNCGFLIWLGITRCSFDCLIRDTGLRLVTINHFSMTSFELKKSHKMQFFSVKRSRKREGSEKNFWISLMNGFGEQGGRQKAWYKREKSRPKIQKERNLQEIRGVAGESFVIIYLMYYWSLPMFWHMIHIRLVIYLFTLQGVHSVLKVPFCSQSLYLTPLQSLNNFFHLKQHA